MKVNIREVTRKDIPVLQELSCQTYQATFGESNTEADMELYLATAYDQQKLAAELANPETWFYFAEVAGHPVGYLKCNSGAAQSEAQGSNSLELERIYLRATAQGTGAGQLLLEQAVELAQQLGKTRLWLGVWEHNERAKRFYAKNGFERFGEHTFIMGSDPQNDWLVAKEIQ